MQHTLELNISIEIHFLFVLPEQVSLGLPGAGSTSECSEQQAGRAEWPSLGRDEQCPGSTMRAAWSSDSGSWEWRRQQPSQVKMVQLSIGMMLQCEHMNKILGWMMNVNSVCFGWVWCIIKDEWWEVMTDGDNIYSVDHILMRDHHDPSCIH